ncbi:MAG: hypothetical protein QOH05_2362, partial [Acetobacteraceae bacterium]|nr:hypothetical protein [Acetobacteraceae bacterium]
TRQTMTNVARVNRNGRWHDLARIAAGRYEWDGLTMTNPIVRRQFPDT